MKKILIAFTVILTLLTVFSSCSMSDTVISEKPKLPRESRAPSIIETLTASAITENVIITEIPKTTKSPDIQTKPEIELYLSSVFENPSKSFNGKNPAYDEIKKGFSIYFDSPNGFLGTESCYITIISNGNTESFEGVLDFTIGNGDFGEEGIYDGVGIGFDYEFKDNIMYHVYVKMESENCIYTFDFLY